MLAPNLNDTYNRLTDSYTSITSLDGFSSTVLDLQILTLPKDPSWLPGVRHNLGLLKSAANSWQINRPNIWAPVLLAFSQYASVFQSIPKQTKDLDSAKWLDLINSLLLPEIQESLLKLKGADDQLKQSRSEFSNVLPLIDQSIAQGWSELGQEEKAMQQLATELGNLSAQASALGAKITSDAISGNKDILTNSVKMLYAAASAGAEASIPVLGIAIAVITISKGFYDLAKDSQELADTMRKVTQIQTELSNEALGLALTKGTLQVLYNLEKQYLSTQDALPLLIDLITTEATKLTDARNALMAGANPKQYIDLVSVPSALSNWEQINQFVNQLIKTDPQVTAPVVLDIGKAEVTQLLTAVPTIV